jgi:two-component system, sensor histidine kinase and response regulator
MVELRPRSALDLPQGDATVDLDLDGALKRLGGDRELLVRVIDFVVEDSPALVRQMESALEADRLGEVQQAAHTLRGLVSNVTCSAIQSQTVELESLALSGDRAGVANALQLLVQLLNRMMAKLAEAHRELNRA